MLLATVYPSLHITVNYTSYVINVCCRIKKSELLSANSLVKLRRCSSIPFMYTKNKNGPRTDPYDTPAKINFKPEKQDLRPISFAFFDLNNCLTILKVFLQCHFAVALIKVPYARLYQMFLKHHRTQCKITYHYKRPSIYYERYQLTEKPLSGEVRSQIDTCIKYCQVENIHAFKNNPFLQFSNTAQ